MQPVHVAVGVILDPQRNILITRLAHGIPVGGELGYVDGFTLTHAFRGRKPLTD